MTKQLSLETLQQIKPNFTSEIEQYVIEDLEEHGNEWHAYLQDIINHGCISGTVSSLIYYEDTIKFHDTYESDIDEIINNYLESRGEKFSQLAWSFNFKAYELDALKNWKAWFAFECIASNINSYIEDIEN